MYCTNAGYAWAAGSVDICPALRPSSFPSCLWTGERSVSDADSTTVQQLLLRTVYLLICHIWFSWRTHTHPFNGPLSGTTRVSQYQKEETNMDFTEARDSEWQWHQLVHMQVCTLLQSDNHASTPPLSFLQVGCPSCCPTNSVKALKVILLEDLLFILPNWTELAVYG